MLTRGVRAEQPSLKRRCYHHVFNIHWSCNHMTDRGQPERHTASTPPLCWSLLFLMDEINMRWMETCYVLAFLHWRRGAPIGWNSFPSWHHNGYMDQKMSAEPQSTKTWAANVWHLRFWGAIPRRCLLVLWRAVYSWHLSLCIIFFRCVLKEMWEAVTKCHYLESGQGWFSWALEILTTRMSLARR